MIQIPSAPAPTKATLKQLAAWQSEVDAQSDYASSVQRGKDLFSSKNKKGLAVFDAIKSVLRQHCQGAGRCAYCEDSLGDEVEHVRPKDHFPEHCFNWQNYVFACGGCNGPKRNKFAVYVDGTNAFVKYGDAAWRRGVAPPHGKDVLINVREEDPMEFALLDLTSFIFRPLTPEDNGKTERFLYTYEDVLNLNGRELLVEARKNAFISFRDHLKAYVVDRDSGELQPELDVIKEGVQKSLHQTVWQEMKRYHRNGWLKKHLPKLDDLFSRAPEVLNW